MKRQKTISALALLLVAFMVLPGCIGQEEEPPTTITQTQTATQTGTVTVTTMTTEPEVTNPYIWSGKLDGEGIPPDFFSDVNIRKGFCYSFDSETYLRDAWKGEAIYPVTPIIEGLPYRNPDQEGYYLDLDKAAEHFKLAWDGKVWELGFKMTLLYNTGNVQRKVQCEIMKENVESLNEKFFIYVRSTDWPTMLDDIVAGRLTMYSIGWGADYPDPHNFAYPFMHSTGTFSGFQLYSNPHVDELIEEGGASTDPVRRKEIYYELQQIYIDEAPSLMTHQATGRRWERDWMIGWYYEGGVGGEVPVYSLSKAPGAKNPDTYVLATIGEQRTMDPAWAYDNASGNLIALIYETLIDYADSPKKVPETTDTTELTRDLGNFKPVLAEEVPTIENGGISADGMTYTLKIKKGIKFQNGNDLTPEDVEYSFERLMVMDRAGGPAWMHFEPLLGNYGTRSGGEIVVPFEDIDAAVEVDGDNVVFHLAQPFPPMINILCMPYGSAILDKDWAIENGAWPGTAETYEEYNNPENSPINDIAMGTGPYKLDRWDKEVETWLVRWDDYRGGAAALKYYNRQSIDEWSTRKLLFQAGDCDSAYVPRQYIEEMEGIPGIRMIPGFPDLGGTGLFFQFVIQP